MIMSSKCETEVDKKAGKELSIVNQCEISSIMFTIK